MASLCNFNKQPAQVLVEGDSFCKKVILNRPDKLNCLNYRMIVELLKHFQAIEIDSDAKFVILKGNGRAFCAGGDVVSYVNISSLSGHWHFGATFTEKQFQLDYILATYKKPLVSLIDGIVMGGGAGISMHSTFKIVTENAVFAMPEAAIGLIPDCGASHFLSRLPSYFGEFLGLTGARLNGAEMLHCGLATHFVPSKDLGLLEKQLVKAPNMSSIHDILRNFTQTPTIKDNSPLKRLKIINRCFSKDTVEEILLALEQEAKHEAGTWITRAIASITSASPTSLKLTLRLIREGRMQSLSQCLICEYKLCCNIARAAVSHDLYEGSRAMLFDKDKKPKWEPSRLELVSEEMVDRCFSDIDDDDWKTLQLPIRSTTILNSNL